MIEGCGRGRPLDFSRGVGHRCGGADRCTFVPLMKILQLYFLNMFIIASDVGSRD